MARGGLVGFGVFLILLAVAGYITPIGSEGHTIPQLDDVCRTALGELGQAFSAEVLENCREFSLLTLGIYGSGLIGFILIIVGAVTGGHVDEEKIYLDLTKKYQKILEQHEYQQAIAQWQKKLRIFLLRWKISVEDWERISEIGDNDPQMQDYIKSLTS